jgi:quercetin dioxygenase-like cupin family protein
VLSGSVLNAMNDSPITTKHAGESFYEAPGCWHRVSDNASKTEEATLLVNFIIDTEVVEKILAENGFNGLVVIDEEYREAVKAQLENLKV